MSADEAFFDTNIILYLVSAESEKAELAEDLLSEGGVVSVQVLNEFVDVAGRKYRASWNRIREVLSTIRAVCTVEPVRIDTHERALQLAERYQYRIYDSLIIAAALQAGCRTLVTEDLRAGQRIEHLIISNPFVRH